MQNKTDAEWNQIRFQNSLGPQIGGLIHDAVALTIAYKDVPGVTPQVAVKRWLDTLYEIAEQKKAELTEVKPLDVDKAVDLGKKWKAGYDKESKQEEINSELQAVSDKEREAQDKINYQN